MIELYHGDCLVEMDRIPDGSVDMVLTDPPYGTTDCKWDSVIPFEPMWEQLHRVCRKNAAMVFTASGLFTNKLELSNEKNWRYRLVWEKNKTTGFLLYKKMPLRRHEDIVVFYRALPTYNPIKEPKAESSIKRLKGNVNYEGLCSSEVYNTHPIMKSKKNLHKTLRYPTSIIKINCVNGKESGKHPTQKPVELMEYLIKTYTNEGDTVLDFTMGSGTTGVACVNLNRRFIGIELDEKYFRTAQERISSAQQNQPISDNVIHYEFGPEKSNNTPRQLGLFSNA